MKIGNVQREILLELGRGNVIIMSSEMLYRNYGPRAGAMFTWKDNRYKLRKLTRNQIHVLLEKGLVEMKRGDTATSKIQLSGMGKQYVRLINYKK